MNNGLILAGIIGVFSLLGIVILYIFPPLLILPLIGGLLFAVARRIR